MIKVWGNKIKIKNNVERTILKKKRILIHVNFLNRDVNYQRKKQNITEIKIRIKSETSKY
jgi:hypothetical protein